jgi:YgiT-type zinc finger domain-containing protein
MCDSRRIRRVCETVEFKTRTGDIRVPDVPFDRCDNCGESFFDHEANQRIDAVIFGNRQRLRRRRSA